MTVGMMTVVRDPLGLYGEGETYPASDIQVWLAQDQLPEGMVLEADRLVRVVDGELKRCDGRGNLTPQRHRVQTNTRDRVLAEMARRLEAGESLDYQDIAEALGFRSKGTIGWHARQMEADGLIERPEHPSVGELHITDWGWRQLYEGSWE